ARAPPSTRHSNEAPDSVAWKVKLLPFRESMTVSGAVVSTVHVRVAGEASVSAAVFARTSNTCTPSASALKDFGDEHAPHVPPSRRHSKLALDVGELNANDADAVLTVPLGPLSICVSGGPSMVQLELAGVA